MEPPPQIYKFIGSYKFKYNECNQDDVFIVNIYKYAGLYVLKIKYKLSSQWTWFLNKNIMNKSINILKNKYKAKKTHLSFNKLNTIQQCSEESCLFECPSCDHSLFIRGLIWEEDNEWEKCENEGIYLKSDRTFEFKYRTPPHNIVKYDISEKDCINSEEAFIQYIDKAIKIYTSNANLFCDVCYDGIHEKEILFCEKCLNDSEFFNLCIKCYTQANIFNHYQTEHNMNNGVFVIRNKFIDEDF